MTRTFVLVSLSALTLTAAVACSGSDDDGTTPSNRDGGTTSSSSSSSSGSTEEDGGDTVVDRAEEREDQGSGATFTDLYRDLFGPTGKASCSGDGLCHGGPTQAGALGSSGYVCASDKDACYASMTSSPGLASSVDATEPENSTLYLVLRHRRPDGSITGSMPKRPFSFVLNTSSMDRIATWIRNGARND